MLSLIHKNISFFVIFLYLNFDIILCCILCFFLYKIFSYDDMSSKEESQDISKWERTTSIGLLTDTRVANLPKTVWIQNKYLEIGIIIGTKLGV